MKNAIMDMFYLLILLLRRAYLYFAASKVIIYTHKYFSQPKNIVFLKLSLPLQQNFNNLDNQISI